MTACRRFSYVDRIFSENVHYFWFIHLTTCFKTFSAELGPVSSNPGVSTRMTLPVQLFCFSILKDRIGPRIRVNVWFTGTDFFFSSGTKQRINYWKVRNRSVHNDKAIDTWPFPQPVGPIKLSCTGIRSERHGTQFKHTQWFYPRPCSCWKYPPFGLAIWCSSAGNEFSVDSYNWTENCTQQRGNHVGDSGLQWATRGLKHAEPPDGTVKV